MKKINAILAFVIICFTGGKAYAQFSLNIEYTPINYHSKYAPLEITIDGENHSLSPTSITMKFFGISAGALYTFNLKHNLALSTGGSFRWNHKYAPFIVYQSGVSSIIEESIYNYLFVDIPLTLEYNIMLNHKWKLSPFIGTAFSFNLVGIAKTNYFETIYDATTGESYKPEDTKQIYHQKPNIFGISGATISYSHFNINAGYRIGLLDLLLKNNPRTTTHGLFVGFGYTF